ncbi:hypothetical protein EPUS_03121 [Endocarpon pusillum Z07020]|uniref:Metal homeostatis protein bsd2 n=1 Tax=Endocarpon pusillum (strain Z07020 / HMAS-L-300199) TaxID=1263415 RepID=U1GM17_ENDPU|nr:uncharacterized protein EPUS_03121 [Endocarpon pusillum Z07020]ERF73288.1 hypothetical protein EPUS_03121 [Endocarpon pusillum Z07020]
MSPQRYEPVNAHDDDDIDDNNHGTPITQRTPISTPSSPPPSFRSQASSPTFRRLLSRDDPLHSDEDQTLADTFDDGEDSDAEDGGDDRQRLMRADPDARRSRGRPATGAKLPVFTPTAPPSRQQPRGGNDGVFANLAAKPERGDSGDEKPPTYESAAADATPPYWETTITLPGSGVPGSDEVYVDGLPVGSIFSFAWNAMISMSFQLVGFLLTYLLHTTHAAKNGSRAGLGLTLVQYGFYMKGTSKSSPSPGGGGDGQFGGGGGGNAPPTDPNSHDFDPSSIAASAAAAAAATSSTSASSSGGGLSSLASSDWVSYLLMIVGWFILIRAVSDFLRARRHEALVLQSPDRGLAVPVIAEGEAADRVV